jgi:hypothetical protein
MHKNCRAVLESNELRVCDQSGSRKVASRVTLSRIRLEHDYVDGFGGSLARSGIDLLSELHPHFSS